MDSNFRKFWLVNSLGDTLFLSDSSKSKIFLNNPTGLGYTKKIAGSRYGNRFNPDDKNTYYEFNDISGEFVYHNYSNENIYEDYYNFIKFVRFSPLKLYYQTPNSYDSYFIDCDIITCSKDQVQSEDSTMRCPITVKPFSFWELNTEHSLVVEPVPEGGLFFPLSIPFGFGGNSLNNIHLINNSMLEIGLILTVNGVCNNPTIKFFNNGKQYGVVRFLGIFDYVYVDSNDNSEEVILKSNGVTLSQPLNYQDLQASGNTKSNVTFIKLLPGENILTFSSENNFDGNIEFKWRDEYVSI